MGNQTEEGAYLVTGTKAKNTHRQFTSDIDYTGNPDGDVGRGGGEGYLTNNYEAKIWMNNLLLIMNTQEQLIANMKNKSYDDAYNAQLNYNKKAGWKKSYKDRLTSIGESDINIDIKN